MPRTSEWEIVSRDERKSGTYFRLNLPSKGNTGAVTVKARAGAGAPYVCLTCRLNECEHVAFVRDRDTAPDAAEAAIAAVPAAEDPYGADAWRFSSATAGIHGSHRVEPTTTTTDQENAA